MTPRIHEKAIFLGLTVCTLSQQISSFVTPSPARVSFLGAAPSLLWRTRLSINLNSKDPFEILDLKADPNLDKQQIKRAYKRLALKYHPDVVINSSSTAEEKAKAGEIFAKINWAYATLSGKNGESTVTASSSSATGKSAYNAGGYQPPHRRTASAYTNPNTSTDWRDFMPKYDEEDAKYDAGGDSFGKILSDILTGVSGVAAGATVGGGGGLVRDFLEFLERNVDGYSGDDNDSDLLSLLSVGTLEDVGNEMDDTELVVQQLSSKMKNIDDELLMVQADLKVATKFSEKSDFSERLAELEARKKIVKSYLEKARKRLIPLQSRYKALIVGGLNDRRAGGRTRSSSYSAPSPDTSGSSPSSSTTFSSTTSNNRDGTSSDGEDSWKTQGFSSSGRRGSNRRSRVVETASREPSKPPPSQEPAYQAPPKSTTSSGPTPLPRQEVNPASSNSNYSSVPPHRRASSYPSDDKRRLREIKVDEEFEKLKKDLGMP